MTTSASLNAQGEWIYPQHYYQDDKPISKKRLLEQIRNNPLIQEARQLDQRIGALIDQAEQQRCVYGYNRLELFYDYYKPRLSQLVGWDAKLEALRTEEHYDTMYEAISDLLPADEVDLYPEGVMPNGMFSPTQQEKYGREYP